jgi:hypothetical protein
MLEILILVFIIGLGALIMIFGSPERGGEADIDIGEGGEIEFGEEDF